MYTLHLAYYKKKKKKEKKKNKEEEEEYGTKFRNNFCMTDADCEYSQHQLYKTNTKSGAILFFHNMQDYVLCNVLSS